MGVNYAHSLLKLLCRITLNTSYRFIQSMNDLLIGYSVTLAFVCVLGGLLCVYRYYLGNKLIDQSQKLKSQIAKIRQDFPELGEVRGKAVASAIGDIGIEGIMDELGIDPKLLTNPLVKGLIDRYAPKLIEKLSKQGEGGNEQQQPFGKGFM
jgi:hypothetical protein